MKKISIVGLLLVVVAVATYAIDPVYMSNKLGNIVEPGQTHTAQNAWINIDTTTSAGDEPTDPGVTERTYLTIVAAIAADSSGDGEISIYGDSYAERVNMSSFNLARFRCLGTTADDDVDYEIYLGTLEPGDTDCILAKAGTLEFVVGTQVSATTNYLVADAVVVTAADWPKGWAAASAANNSVAEAAIDLMGANVVVAVPFTADGNCKLLMKGY